MFSGWKILALLFGKTTIVSDSDLSNPLLKPAQFYLKRNIYHFIKIKKTPINRGRFP
jgi:hypothetical protein